MKYLIMCEGPNELEIIRMLLEHDKVIFTEDDLLNLVPYCKGRAESVSRRSPGIENWR